MIKDLGIWTIKYVLSIYYFKIWQKYTLEIQRLKKNCVHVNTESLHLNIIVGKWNTAF